MQQVQLNSLLENITGHLSARTKAQQKDLETMRRKLANSLQFSDDTGSNHLFAFSDLYDHSKIDQKTISGIKKISEQVKASPVDEGLRSYVRDTPVGNTQLGIGAPAWAAASRPVETFGPFAGNDGRNIWVDFYRTTKLVTVYLDGQAVLLFKTPQKLLVPKRRPPAESSFTISPGSVWIRANIFNISASGEDFIGLKALSGSLKVNKPTAVRQGKIEISNPAVLKLSVKIAPQTTMSAATSPFAQDSKEANFQLPGNFDFTFDGQTKKLTQLVVGNSQADIFGQSLQLNFDNTSTPGYNQTFHSIAFPMKSSQSQFRILKSSDAFLSLSGEARIKKSHWMLPAARIDLANPMEVDTNGSILFECQDGLGIMWNGLDGQDIRLAEPMIVGAPGAIGIMDSQAKGTGAVQSFELWNDGARNRASTFKATFLKETNIIAVISADQGTEMVMVTCKTDFAVDRPVTVSGTPFDAGSDNSVLSLGAGPALLSVNVVGMPTSNIGAIANIPASHSAIALTNALLTVAPAQTLLFAEANDDWKKLQRGHLYQALQLLKYTPTLPDPYLAMMSKWQRTSMGGTGMLVSAVNWLPLDENGDKIETKFYLGTLPTDFNRLPEDDEKKEDIDKTLKNIPPKNRLPRRVIKKVSGRNTAGQTFSKLNLLKTPVATSVKVTSDYLARNKEYTNVFLDHLKDVIGPVPGVSAPTGDAEFLVSNFPKNYEQELLKNGNSYENLWDDSIISGRLSNEAFALLDVSSNANQLGISVGFSEFVAVKTGQVIRGNDNNFAVQKTEASPFVIDGMEMKIDGRYVRLFTLPQVAWEPSISDAPKELAMDPDPGILFYENDGGPTRVWNNNAAYVPLAPLPVVRSIIEDFKSNPNNYTLSALTLPFGLKAIAFISKNFLSTQTIKPDLQEVRPQFRKDREGKPLLEGASQISMRAGNHGKKLGNISEHDLPMFPGYTVQLNNLLNLSGYPSGESNLGHRVTQIFNNEFVFGALTNSTSLKDSRGVPVSRMDLTGYGANMFSDWLSPAAALAQTSQAKFDVMHGRTAHEVIQVKSILYPWGIRVVRTITLFRDPTGFVLRTDSGWKAESDGKFDFSFKYSSGWKLKGGIEPYKSSYSQADFEPGNQSNEPTVNAPYEFHPGVIKGLFNITNIRDTDDVAEFHSVNQIPQNSYFINGITGKMMKNTSGAKEEPVLCGAVYFDADIEIENVVKGESGKGASIDGTKYPRVASKKILGFVQVQPAGKPLTAQQLSDLIDQQKGSIGGAINCVVDVNNSTQQMRLIGFDVSNSADQSGKSVFVVAARGTLLLPAAGSWTVVQHAASTGQVTSLPSGTSVPLIRQGKWVKSAVIDPGKVKNELLRIAHPLEILRAPSDESINFGLLQSTGTQKALFLTPSYGKMKKMLMSRTPPVFADAYRLMEGSSIFPNIGNALDNFGKAMPMLKGIDNAGKNVEAFIRNNLKDGGERVFELLELKVEKAGEEIIDQGMQLLQKNANGALDKALRFDIPSFDIPLVDTKALRIYIEYKTSKQDPKDPEKFVDNVDGKVNFDIDSFTGKLEDQWKSRVNNLAMVVDLGDMKRLMTIKGNFDAGKGKETGLEGGPDSGKIGLPVPEIEFSPALQPVIDILEILAQMSEGDYGAVMKKGLQIAMSNSGEVWEYKFEASKEIPAIRFPPTDEAYNSAQTPLRLEASLGLGVYFNAALKVTTDLKELLPTAGAFLKFHGGMEVMCASIGVGSIYAKGSVDVIVACDTKSGPSLTLNFAFGVSIVVSLPVVGHASVTYLMGINMTAGTKSVVIAALMSFKGNAELAGGLVSVTIYIEAKGIIEKQIGEDKTNAYAQVTFALDISVAFIINISFSKTWGEQRQIA